MTEIDIAAVQAALPVLPFSASLAIGRQETWSGDPATLLASDVASSPDLQPLIPDRCLGR